jgi:hypothetical protein
LEQQEDIKLEIEIVKDVQRAHEEINWRWVQDFDGSDRFGEENVEDVETPTSPNKRGPTVPLQVVIIDFPIKDSPTIIHVFLIGNIS